MATIAIILPIYNGEKHLREAIDSVLRQTYTDFELWVMNDGCTDGSMQIVGSYADPRIRRIDNPTNLGLVPTLNRALGMATAPFVARIDADDLWHPRKLELQMALLAQRPDVGICGTSIHKFGDIDEICLFPQEADALKVGLLFYCMMSHPSVVYRQSFLQQTGLRYCADYYPAEDYKMWVDALQHTHIYNLPQPLVEYRQHNAQICRVQSIEQQALERQLREEQLRLIYPHPTAEELAFHLNHYTTLCPRSEDEAEQYVAWTSRLIEANLQSRYVDPSVMQSELQRYCQNALRTFYRSTYAGLFHHLRTGRWHRLDLRHNLGLVLHH